MEVLLIDIHLKIVLQKFSSVADATREIELGRLSLDDRNNGNNQVSSVNEIKMVNTSAFTSPHGSLNENLNMPVPTRGGSRHQSISEKLIIIIIIHPFKQLQHYR